MPDIKKKILEILEKHPIAAMATITEEGKPWVRYVSLTASDDLTMRTATGLKSRKVEHIKKNPEIHMTCGYTPGKPGPYLQIQAHATISTAAKEKKAIWNDHLAEYFSGPDDLNFGVVIVKPYRIEFMDWSSKEPKVWKA
ncbi:MAG: pyridoxamine 5'-phosphate oxidase family protein [Candidatus Riflebacteria bacterium]|nr:pyridoxamine 5'-phosphate oxidase family protein [Candidatus Riflebacteria bacterium]